MAAIYGVGQGNSWKYTYAGFLHYVQARIRVLTVLSQRVPGPMRRMIARRIATLRRLAALSETQYRANSSVYAQQLRSLGGGASLPDLTRPPTGPVSAPAPTAGFGDHGVDGLGSIVGDATERVVNVVGVSMMVGAIYLSIKRHGALKLWPTLGAVFFPPIALPYQAAMTVLKK